MINIIDNKNDAKKYTDAIAALFRLYRINGEVCGDVREADGFYKIVNKVKADSLYQNEPLKKEIVKAHMLSGEPLVHLAERMSFSTSYVYSVHHSIIKDFAMLIFKVIIL